MIVAPEQNYVLKQLDANTYVVSRTNPIMSLPPIIFSHGSGGTKYSITPDSPNGMILPTVLQNLVAAGYAVFCSDLAFENWGNDAGKTAFATCWALAVSLGWTSSTCIPFGMSMGALVACGWSASNSSSVAGILLAVPCIDLAGEYTYFPTAQSGIDAAYGGHSAMLAALATHDPGATTIKSAIATLGAAGKVAVSYSNPDAFVDPAKIASWCTAVGANVLSISTTGNHAWWLGTEWDDRLMRDQCDIWTGRAPNA